MNTMISANRIGLIGVLIAILGICCAVFQDDIRKQLTPDSPKVQASGLIDAGIKIFSTDNNTPVARDKVDYLYLGLGVLALILGVISYLIKENYRVSTMAGALGIMVLAWQYILIGIIAGIIIAIVIMIVSNFSLS